VVNCVRHHYTLSMENENGTHGLPEEEWVEVSAGFSRNRAVGSFSRRRVHLWALVLDSRFVPCQLVHDEHGWRLLTPTSLHDKACEELRCFEEKNRNWPPLPAATVPLSENSLATLSILILLALFHNLTRLDGIPFSCFRQEWSLLGSAQAARILDGQWWRVVTALTLHVDTMHLVSNLAIGGIFVLFLCRELGSGLAWSLILATGTVGNLADASVQLPGHTAVGSSTALFGAVGILAGLTLVRNRQLLPRRWPVPLASAAALLALLGSEGKNSDLAAHLFGLLSGIPLGLITGSLLKRYGRPGRLLNVLLALLSVVVVVAAWLAALASG